MNSYKDITFWENKGRLEKLCKFRNHVVDYFDDTQTDRFGYNPIEGTIARRSRQEINFMVDEVERIIVETGVDVNILWSPPPEIKSGNQHVNAILNLFNLQRFKIPPQYPIDFIERAIGIYQSDKRKSVFRTFNPFWWIKRILYWFTRIPFSMMGAVGFKTARLENNILGRLLKAFFGLIPIAASLLAILAYMGWLDHLRFAIGIVD